MLFAEGTQLFRLEKPTEDCDEFQKNLIKVGNWAKLWQINFIEGEYKAMLY